MDTKRVGARFQRVFSKLKKKQFENRFDYLCFAGGRIFLSVWSTDRPPRLRLDHRPHGLGSEAGRPLHRRRPGGSLPGPQLAGQGSGPERLVSGNWVHHLPAGSVRPDLYHGLRRPGLLRQQAEVSFPRELFSIKPLRRSWYA